MSHKEFFPNGYGVSIISHQFSYGLELAVLKGDEKEYEICYDTPITSDVIGHCSAEQLTELIKDVKALPSCIKNRRVNGKNYKAKAGRCKK